MIFLVYIHTFRILRVCVCFLYFFFGLKQGNHLYIKDLIDDFVHKICKFVSNSVYSICLILTEFTESSCGKMLRELINNYVAKILCEVVAQYCQFF